MPLWERCGRWSYRFTIKGILYSGPTGLPATKRNESAARDMEAKQRASVLDGTAGRSRLTLVKFNEASRQFLAWDRGEHRDYPQTAQRTAVSFASINKFFQSVQPSAITDGDIEEFKTWRRDNGIKEVTIRHDLHALSKFFRYALKQRWTKQNPLLTVDIPSDKDAIRIHVLSAEEETAYFTHAMKFPLPDDTARLILNQGMRPEEVHELRTEDVNLARGTVQIRRGKSPAARRTLNLTDGSKAILARPIATNPQGWVFPSPRVPGAHVGRLNFSHDEACKNAGLAFCLYDLRHTFATRMAQAGCDLPSLAAILGHSSLRLVMRYVHPTAEHMRAAMARYNDTIKAQAQGGIQ